MNSIFPYLACAVLATTFILYLIYDGRALALCIFTPFVEHNTLKHIFNDILPSWDANQTWLVFTLAGAYGGFSVLFGSWLSHYYLTSILLLLLLMLRGASIEFYSKSLHAKHFWLAILASTSFGIIITQGTLLSNIILSIELNHKQLANITNTNMVMFALATSMNLLLFNLIQAILYIKKDPQYNRLSLRELKASPAQPNSIPNLSNERWLMLLMGLNFCLTMLYNNKIVSAYYLINWPAQYILCALLFSMNAIVVVFVRNKPLLLKLFLYGISLLASGLLFLRVGAFILPGHQTPLQATSSIPATKIISIAAIFLLPSIWTGLFIIKKIFQSSTEVISY